MITKQVATILWKPVGDPPSPPPPAPPHTQPPTSIVVNNVSPSPFQYENTSQLTALNLLKHYCTCFILVHAYLLVHDAIREGNVVETRMLATNLKGYLQARVG